MPRSMRLILDTHEYIFGLDPLSGQEWSIRLFETLPRLIGEVEDFILFVPDVIRTEVQHNIAPRFVGDFYRLVTSSPKIAYGSLFEVHVTLFQKCRVDLGLNPGHATIAAFADWMSVDFLVSENRHFYKELNVDRFITCTAEKFMKLLENKQVWQVIEEPRKRKE